MRSVEERPAGGSVHTGAVGNLSELAARNNAGWYSAMFEAHGVPFTQKDTFWRALGSPPRFHSWRVTLQAGDAPLADVIALREGGARPVGVKDSFDALDLGPFGLETLFVAEWIHRPFSPREPQPNIRRVETDADLLAWEAGWAEGDAEAPNHPRQFPASLLERDMAFVEILDGSTRVGGCVLNLVGLSNTYVLGGEPTLVWRDFVAAAALLFPDRDVVGYERGRDLELAEAVGFKSAGRLRVDTRQYRRQVDARPDACKNNEHWR